MSTNSSRPFWRVVKWIPVTGKDLAEFAARLELTGLTGDLGENKQQLALTLVGWSVAQDHMAPRRLADIRDTTRDKAGLA